MGKGRGGGGPGTGKGRASRGGGTNTSTSRGGNGGSSKSGGKGSSGASTGKVTNPQGGGSGNGGGASPSPEPPRRLWTDFLVRKPNNDRSTREQRADDIETVNRRYGETFDDPDLERQYNINCTRCSATVEMRARGFDVTAEPRPKSSNDAFEYDIEGMWVDPETNLPPVFNVINEGNTHKEWYRNVSAEVRSYGTGARGFILVEWEAGGAHTFNWEITSEGKVRWIDAQVNKLNAGVDWVRRVKLNNYRNAVMRTDNLEPSEKLVARKWIRNRTPEEINAPSRAELINEVNRLWGNPTLETTALRNAFSNAWDQVRKGKVPKMPDNYQGFPELQDAWNRGITWALRPD